MALPLKPLPTVERWDCHQCGVCCRGSIVPLSEEDLAKLKAQKWEEQPDLAGTPIVQSATAGWARLSACPSARW